MTITGTLRAETGFELASGNLFGDATIDGNFAMSGGFLPGTIQVNREFQWSGGEAEGSVTANERIAWSGGLLSGVMNVSAATQLDVLPGSPIMTGTLNNYGVLRLADLAKIQMDSGCTVNNIGLCETSAGDPFRHGDGGIATFNNSGIFRKLGAPVTTITLNVIFQSSGVVDVVSNTLSFVSGTHTFSPGAQFIGSGLTKIAGATINWNGAVTNRGPLEVASGTVIASGATINGSVGWSGGNWKGALTVPAESVVRLTGAGPKSLIDINLTNRGSMLLEGSGALQFNGDVLLHNYGLLELQAANSFTTPSGGRKNFYNDGILRKKGSALPFLFSSVIFHNNGLLDLQAGFIDFTLNSHSLHSGTRITGAGSVRVDGATLNLGGSITTEAPLVVTSGFLAGTATLIGPLQAAGGALSGALTVNGPIIWPGTTLSGTLQANATMDWSGGTVSGALTIPSGSTLTISGAATKTLSGTLLNGGQVNVSDQASIIMVSGTPINNTGVLDISSDLPFRVSGSSKPIINNSGTLRRSGSIKPVEFGAYLLQNSGTIDLQSSDVTFLLNEHTLADGTRSTGPKAIRILGAVVTMSGRQQLNAPFVLGSGILKGAANIDAGVPMTWGGGILEASLNVMGNVTWNGSDVVGMIVQSGTNEWIDGTLSGSLRLTTDSTMNVVKPGRHTISGQLNNAGTVVVVGDAAFSFNSGTPIINSGVLELQNEKALLPNGSSKVTLVNSGTLRKTVAPQAMVLSYVLLQNSGNIELMAGDLQLALSEHWFHAGTTLSGSGALRVKGATLTLAGIQTYSAPFEMASGLLAGNALVNGNVTFSGGQIDATLVTFGAVAFNGGLAKGALFSAGSFAWTGGQLEGALTIATNSVATFSGSPLKWFKGSSFTNHGILALAPAVSIQATDGAELYNFGMIDAPANATFVHNSGDVRSSSITVPSA